MTNIVGPPGNPNERVMPPISGERPDNNEQLLISQLLDGFPSKLQTVERGTIRIHASTIDNPNAPHPEGDWREVVGSIGSWKEEPRRLNQLIVNWGHKAPTESGEETFHSRLHIQHDSEGRLEFSTLRVSERPGFDKEVDEHREFITGDNIDAVMKEIDNQAVAPFNGGQTAVTT